MAFSTKCYRIGFFFVLAFYCLFFARFGFENWDTGFVASQSWRVANGEVAFRDFLSVRPPVTAYFHGLIMSVLPDYAQVYTTRVLGYCLFALQVFFVVDGLDRLFRLRKYKIDKWGAMLFAFVMATGAIYPDPWFTVDGIFFASAAFFVLTLSRRPKWLPLVSTALLCVLSAGTKQSFYFVPVFFTAWIFVCFGWKKASAFVAFSGIFTAILLSIFISTSSLSDILYQLGGTGNSHDFIDLGLLAYLNVFQAKWVWLGLFALSFGFAFVNSGNRFPSGVSVLKWFALATFLSALAAIPIFGFPTSATVLLVAVKIAFWRKTRFNRIRIASYLPIVVLVGIAWCASLSKGFPFPVLFCHALALCFFILMYDDLGDYRIKRLYLFVSVPLCVYLFIGNFDRYREQEFSKLDVGLGSVSPKLAFVVSSESAFGKLSELKQLREKYIGKYVVAPSLPQAYYLFDDRNPLPADWLTTFELKNDYAPYLSATALTAKYVFLEKSFVKGEPYLNPKDDKDDFSQYANYILKHMKPLEKGRYFWVYDASELTSTLRKYPINTIK